MEHQPIQCSSSDILLDSRFSVCRSAAPMLKLQVCLIFLELLLRNFSVGFYSNSKSCGARGKCKFVTQLGTQDSQADNDFIKKIIPQRRDTCKLLISGVIGTEPKEAYLSNNHYVINFALAVVGHFEPIHDWEKNKVIGVLWFSSLLMSLIYKSILTDIVFIFTCIKKHAETMWINVEVWDDVAKNNVRSFRKGAALNGLGTLLIQKWTDKASGEERKQFKHRLLKIMTPAEMNLFESPVGSSIASEDFQSAISARTIPSATDGSDNQQTNITDDETVSLDVANVETAQTSLTAPVVPKGPINDGLYIPTPRVRQKPATRYGTYDPDAE